ncbi:hypothetical protein CAEBREN_07777 [Caenorhabditis brenneri]|uniref:Uncharacterized protein n=1 Tax=Caenorhabditis brenneri TaxID=135651 RepID=G0NTK7_CAEBE|nr:hypothetical protein CAEBREN_07777 [Caenorhabditis brenneri]
MKTLILLLAVISFAYAFNLGIGVPNGSKDVNIEVSRFGDIKSITRKLKSGGTQVWNLTGPNKGTWVDSKGKKIPSSNYSFKAPGSIVIKKVSKADEGVYDYEPLTTVKPEKLPPGVHVDPHQQGVELSVL